MKTDDGFGEMVGQSKLRLRISMTMVSSVVNTKTHKRETENSTKTNGCDREMHHQESFSILLWNRSVEKV